MKRAGRALALAVVCMLAASGQAAANHWESTPSGAPFHWADNDPNYPRGYVYWVDKTGAEWPVYRSAVEWDEAAKLDAMYVSSEAACPNTGHCVTVKEESLGTSSCGPQLGKTSMVAYDSTGHLTTATEVAIDTSCSGSADDKRRTIVCHELGHSIGMDDQTVGASTCMRSPYAGPWTTPSSHDYDAIASHYGHKD